MGTGAEAHFAQTYAEARRKFLAAAEAAGAALQSHPHPLPGRDGEALALDVARLGPADAQALLVVSSACHGVEGFCGSGVQHALLEDAGFLHEARQAGVALLFLHALNPYGFSWWRRVTHENVDLNRNFHDFSQPLPANAAYAEVAPLLLPAAWPPGADDEAAMAAYLQRHGMKGFQAAVSGGQHSHPQGLFFGGTAPTWSNTALRQVLREQAGRARRIGWIDVHTGLGPSGHGERIFAARDDAATLARARAWWGPQVTSIYDGSSSSARLTGMLFGAVYDECPQASYTGIALEFGTEPMEEVMSCLRAEQWMELHPEAPPTARAATKRRFRDAFYTDTPVWKAQVLSQAAEAARQGVAGLAG